MATSSRQDILLSIGSPDELFNAPSINPFTTQDLSAMGEPAIMRAVSQIEALGRRKSKNLRLIIMLPRSQVTTYSPSQIAEAIKRYCTAKIDANVLEMRRARRRHTIGLVMVILLLLLIGALVYLLYITLLADASPVVQGVVVGFFTVFAWVIVWDPLEGLIFDPVGPTLEDQNMRRIRDAEIVVKSAEGAA